MKRNLLTVLIVSILLVSCDEKKVSEIPSPTKPIDALEVPNTTIDYSMLNYDRKTSLWTLNDQFYSGYAVKYYSDSLLMEKFGILNGRKQNQANYWYPDGHYKRVANYHKGKLHGAKKTWSSDSVHVLVAHLNYYMGKVHGEQIKWYTTGEVFKKLNLTMGKEEGIQQAFRKNGDLFANYEAREGRIFGLKKSALCFGLEDETIQYAK